MKRSTPLQPAKVPKTRTRIIFAHRSVILPDEIRVYFHNSRGERYATNICHAAYRLLTGTRKMPYKAKRFRLTLTPIP